MGTQHLITDQKTKYLEKREEMFQKVSVRVESRLSAFVDDIKFMQKTVKKEMGESNSTERGRLGYHRIIYPQTVRSC